MTNLDDQTLLNAENRGVKGAFDLLKSFFEFLPLPKQDEVGIMRHGYGRPIQSRPMTKETAEHGLRTDLMRSQTVLKGRIFELLAVHPESEDKIKYLYAIADVFGPEVLRDTREIWDTARKGDWREVGTQIMLMHWDRYFGVSTEKRRAVLNMVMDMSA